MCGVKHNPHILLSDTELQKFTAKISTALQAIPGLPTVVSKQQPVTMSGIIKSFIEGMLRFSNNIG